VRRRTFVDGECKRTSNFRCSHATSVVHPVKNGQAVTMAGASVVPGAGDSAAIHGFRITVGNRRPRDRTLTTMHGALIAVLLACGLPGVAHAQRGAPVLTLGPREVEAAATFSQVRGFRELHDGRLLVTDQVERKIVLLDLAERTARAVGRQGPGPAEYQIATDLIATGSDTTLLYDVARGHQTLAIVTPDGRIDGARRLPPGGVMSFVFQVDGAGRLYAVSLRIVTPGVQAADSVPVLRSDFERGTVDTAFCVPTIPQDRMAPNPYNPRNQWAVGRDGRAAIVDVERYRVTWIAPDGRRTIGDPIPFDRIPVTQRDKDEFRDLARRVQGIGVAGATTSDGGRAGGPVVTFPRYKPPYFGNFALMIAPTGELWVRRSQEAGAKAPVHDIIDGSGRRIATVALPADTRLLALGTRGVYLARFDEDDVIHIQRHPYPMLPSAR
jgi:hypothetical protein